MITPATNEFGRTLAPLPFAVISSAGDIVIFNTVTTPTTTTPNPKQNIRSLVDVGILLIRCYLNEHNIPDIPLVFIPNIKWNSNCFRSVGFNCI